MNIEQNTEFTHAFTLIEHQGESIFLTGKPGTGKSTFLRHLIQQTDKRIACVAPTGIAALNVGGQTIHSFFKFGIGVLKPGYGSMAANTAVMRALDILVIDEISMVRCDVLDAIDQSLRMYRRRLDTPFGGVQVVLCGDLFQLPPVLQGADLTAYFTETYGGPYFFYAHLFRASGIEMVELQKVYRQTDEDFLTVLHRLREGNVDDEFVRALNARCFCLTEPKPEAIVLTATNHVASQRNQEALDALPGESRFCPARIDGNFPEKAYPTDVVLELKIGARVMFLRNDSDKRWVNGTMATVTQIDRGMVGVEIDGTGERAWVEEEEWENHSYEFTGKSISQRITGTFTQFPLRHAWAITIHKSQGQTFDNVLIDLGRGAFAHGQAYVALSRCRTLDGIQFYNPVQKKDFVFDEAIFAYKTALARKGVRQGVLMPEKTAGTAVIAEDNTSTASQGLIEGERVF